GVRRALVTSSARPGVGPPSRAWARPHHAAGMILHGLKSACAFYRQPVAPIAAAARTGGLAHHAPVLAVLLVTALLYLPTLSADFVTFDEHPYVVENADLRTPAPVRILDPRPPTRSDRTPAVALMHDG